MKRFFTTVLCLQALLFGALTFDSNHNKEIALMESFDLPPSFLNDPLLVSMKEKKRAHYQNKHFFKAMDDAYLFIPMIKSLLAESDVPVEFLFLAMAESNFSTKAYSKKSASGLWQFMSYTGRRYGLKIDEYVDERRDLVKSTRSAIKYLTYLHERFGKWYLAALAYNCGEGRVSRAIKRAGTDDIYTLLNAKKGYLPRESRYYIRRIAALALLGSDESFLIDREYDYLLNRANAYSLATIRLRRGEKLSRVAKILDMPYEELRRFNRHLKYDFMPPHTDDYEVYIPFVKYAEFKQKYTPRNLQEIYMVHTVKPGDNLSRLGRKYGVTYKAIKDFNKLNSTILSLNQKLIIPVSKPLVKTAKKRKSYTVRRGDTLGSISRRFHVSIRNLKQINHLEDNTIRIGERLTLNDY